MSLRAALADWLFPPRCLVCGEVVPRRAALCPDCREELPLWRIKEGFCPTCGKPPGSCVCENGPFAFSRCLSAAVYGPALRGAVDALKHDPASPVAGELAALMARVLRDSGEPLAFDHVTEVPMSTAETARRGHNQAHTLAAAVALLLGLPHGENRLNRREDSAVQHELSAFERARNAKASYAARPGARLSGRVLLVDDVATTCATLNRCAALLRDCGADEVICLTAATTPLRQIMG